MRIRTVLMRLSPEIRQDEIPLFRGAVNAILDDGHNILFHNHQGDKLRYSYPLIQYKRIGGRAAILCIGEEGANAISEFFEKGDVSLRIGNRNVMCEEDEVIAKRQDLEVTRKQNLYTVRKWIPFNKENYEAYSYAVGIVERIQILEKIMTGNILSMAKGLGVEVQDTLEIRIHEILGTKTLTFKGVKMMSFDLVFSANISIPDFFGLGKGVSHGFGVVTNI